MKPARFVMGILLAAGITMGGRTGLPGFRLVDPGPTKQEYEPRIRAIPEQVGDWRLEAEAQLDKVVTDLLECGEAYVSRRYVHPRLGGSVDLILLAGPPGPLTAHTPEICYSANAYQLVSSKPFSLDRSLDARIQTTSDPVEPASKANFRRVHLKSTRAHMDDLVVYYAWSDGESWRIPRMPRLAFSSRAAVVKVQIAIPRSARVGQEEEEKLVHDFLRSLLAELDRSVFQKPGGPAMLGTVGGLRNGPIDNLAGGRNEDLE